MAQQTLATKYRPKVWKDVVEQGSIKIILEQQLATNSIKNAYLFCGPAGCGKTTAARIFANDINKGQGLPIEMDAASHNGVDDVRDIIQQAKTKSIDSEYKVFIIDEAHAISSNGWQAFLKIIEEPPAKSIFIFATTDPQKIPKTILSRVQRYDFSKISQSGIFNRLLDILCQEGFNRTGIDENAIEYISKLSEGGMRDSITLLDKALAYSKELTLKNVVKALGTVDYDVMIKLTDAIIQGDKKGIVDIIETIHSDGKDLKQFVKSYLQFLIDVQKYVIGCDWNYINLPKLPEYEKWLSQLKDQDIDICLQLLQVLMKLNTEIKYSSAVKYDIEACLLVF